MTPCVILSAYCFPRKFIVHILRFDKQFHYCWVTTWLAMQNLGPKAKPVLGHIIMKCLNTRINVREMVMCWQQVFGLLRSSFNYNCIPQTCSEISWACLMQIYQIPWCLHLSKMPCSFSTAGFHWPNKQTLPSRLSSPIYPAASQRVLS